MKKLSYYFLLAAIVVGMTWAPTLQSSAAGGMTPVAYLPVISMPGLAPLPSGGLVIDHTSTDITKIPIAYINQARNQFRLSYGHTSHGSQIVTGMAYWMRKDASYSFTTDGSVVPDVLSLADTTPGGDVGYSGWDDLTRSYLNANGKDRNLVMWSWCGQLEGYSTDQVKQYLDDMNKLEQQYPDVRFVYMTQHTVSNEDPANNDLVRNYAKTHNKILFDFADMEKFTPDGAAVPMSQVSDSCPWCADYCSTHASYCADLSTRMDDCAHTDKLLCKIKGQGFWWMMARLVGWNGVSSN